MAAPSQSWNRQA